MTIESLSHWANPEIALDEELDRQDPLRHLMDVEDSLVSLAPATSSQLLAFLPEQSHTVLDDGGMLRLAFTTPKSPSVSDDLASTHGAAPLSITLAVDASPGCGGIAWPAGQVAILNPSVKDYH